MDEFEIPDHLRDERVDRALALLTGFPRTKVVEAIEKERVELDGETVRKPSQRLDDAILLTADFSGLLEPERLDPDESVQFDVVYEDDDVLVVNKPSGLVVHPGAGTREPTLVQGIIARYPEIREVGEPERPGIVHRIDKGTSGLLMVARNEHARLNLIEQLVSRSVERLYMSLLWGHLEADEGVIDAPLARSARNPLIFVVRPEGKEARTRYRVVSRFNDPAPTSLVECQLESGRTHQIRVHAKAIGHSVVGDAQYRGVRGAFATDRMFLHAATLGFVHPKTGKSLRFSQDLPPELVAVLAKFS